MAARGLLDKALTLTQALTEADPKNANLKRDWAMLNNKLGDVTLARGDLPAAHRFFKKALALTKALADADPNNAQGQLDLVGSHAGMPE